MNPNTPGHSGTTSACAENTPKEWGIRAPHGNYLRVRGEYWESFSGFNRSMELPPRARRIRKILVGVGFPRGTTSACAENTRLRVIHHLAPGNYLRVRGEYGVGVAWVYAFWELPPRARRIR